LGYSFCENRKGGSLRIHLKNLDKKKERIKSLTSGSNGWGDARGKETLGQYITDCVNYFKPADYEEFSELVKRSKPDCQDYFIRIIFFVFE